jgi:1-aminocyclopropane-1-carboxylate deaminase/D-cysteine desulfhydrase-like pyridoxal-dependent ACC family enzyme
MKVRLKPDATYEMPDATCAMPDATSGEVRLKPDATYEMPDATDDIEIDDRFVGDGYGIPTVASREAIELAARTEAVFLDPTYTAKAMAGLIACVRAKTFNEAQTVLFWHTGGQVGLFA